VRAFDGVADKIVFGNLGTIPAQGTFAIWFKGTKKNYGNLFHGISNSAIGPRCQVYANGQLTYLHDDAKLVLSSGFQNDSWYLLLSEWDTSTKKLSVVLNNDLNLMK
jgi:hypothetical protein